jgi:hypothetical protein
LSRTSVSTAQQLPKNCNAAQIQLTSNADGDTVVVLGLDVSDEILCVLESALSAPLAINLDGVYKRSGRQAR